MKGGKAIGLSAWTGASSRTEMKDLAWATLAAYEVPYQAITDLWTTANPGWYPPWVSNQPGNAYNINGDTRRPTSRRLAPNV